MTQLSINTTQNVAINFTPASVADRILATLTDLLVKIAYGIVVYFIFFHLLNFDILLESLDQWSIMAIMGVFYLPVAVYSLVLESVLEGQTFGKKLLRIKVVKIDGYQASFSDYLVRWICRIIDVAMLSGVIGLIFIALSPKNQRLGDMAAGTAVISLRSNVDISHTILEEIGEQYIPVYPLVIRLSDNDVRIIKETFNSAMLRYDATTVLKLREKIETVTGIKKLEGSNEEFLRTILKDYNFYTQSM